MLKLIGCSIILIGSYGYGRKRILELNYHHKQLLDFKELLYLLHAEMKHYKRPLTEVFSKVAMKSQEPFSTVFMIIADKLERNIDADSFQIWKEGFEKEKKQFYFSKTEFDLVVDTGHFLEQQVIETQEQELLFYGDQIKLYIEQNRMELREKRKICAYGSILGGIFLIIIFI